jgi:hypothetical protein
MLLGFGTRPGCGFSRGPNTPFVRLDNAPFLRGDLQQNRRQKSDATIFAQPSDARRQRPPRDFAASPLPPFLDSLSPPRPCERGHRRSFPRPCRAPRGASAHPKRPAGRPTARLNEQQLAQEPSAEFEPAYSVRHYTRHLILVNIKNILLNIIAGPRSLPRAEIRTETGQPRISGISRMNKSSILPRVADSADTG